MILVSGLPLETAAQDTRIKQVDGIRAIDSKSGKIPQRTPAGTPVSTAKGDSTLHNESRNATTPAQQDTAAPRLLETHLFSDTLKRERVFGWRHNRYLNTLQTFTPDTSYSAYRVDYPFLQHGVGADYLGTIGSAVVLHNYFKRQANPYFYYFNPYLEYAITPDNIEFYNTKTAYTRFRYSGTLFGNSMFEEGNVGVLVSANMRPAWNGTIQYRHFGTRGMLQHETTDNNAITVSTSYSGKRYNAHAGFIYNGWNNNENGGVTDDSFVLDTVMDVRTLPVTLNAASSKINYYSFFVTHSYGIPLNFFRNDSTLKDDGTAIYLGHAAEYTTISRNYYDQINENDSIGRAFYNEAFYIHPTRSRDSMSMSLFDNKIFLALQPWSASAIVSKLTGGIGYSHVSNYVFRPQFYVSPAADNATQNNFYLYANASGVFRRYFQWSAFSRYDFAGYTQHDLLIDGTVGISLYPLRNGVHLTGNVVFQTRRPDYFLNNTYANHYIWENNFDKTKELKLQAALAIPDWRLEASFNYSLLSDMVYFDNNAQPVQHGGELSILAASVKKDFKLWWFHLEHRILLQISSDNAVLPLPLVSGNLTYYLQAPLVKNVLTAQLGVDMHYNTSYYTHAYSPGAGAFYTQDKRSVGNYPYLDAFIHLKWKHAHIFLKVVNVAERWPNSDFFSTLHYLRPERTFKIGLTWYFY
ncbi:MAG: putative porin [Prevotellaceae bacterium]|nr:putative porin [Prevotellaceae bacterium]